MFEVTCGEGRRFSGKLTTENETSKPVFDWTAIYAGEERWEILPADTTAGSKGTVVDRGFTQDAVLNQAIKTLISGELVSWRRGLASSQGKKIPQSPPNPPTPLPAPPPQVITPVVPVSAKVLLSSLDGIPGEQVLKIPLEEIVCFQKQISDPAFSGQPRKDFDDVGLKKLAGSLKKHGQKVPALVRRIDTIPGKKWELIAGERRWQALQMISFPYLRAIEENPANKQQQHMLSLIENLFRVDPSPLELSSALQEQVEAGETQGSLAEATSLSLTHIRNLLAIQSVHPDLKLLLSRTVPEESRIRLFEAAVLGRIQPDHQVEIWNQAKSQPTHKLIVAKLHELGKPFFQFKRKTHNDRRSEASEVTERLNRRLNTLSLALIELKAVTPEEWRQFIVFRGASQSSTDTACLTEIIRGVDEVKQRISRAKVATKASTLGIIQVTG